LTTALRTVLVNDEKLSYVMNTLTPRSAAALSVAREAVIMETMSSTGARMTEESWPRSPY